MTESARVSVSSYFHVRKSWVGKAEKVVTGLLFWKKEKWRWEGKLHPKVGPDSEITTKRLLGYTEPTYLDLVSGWVFKWEDPSRALSIV